jgi:hypothetical protein
MDPTAVIAQLSVPPPQERPNRARRKVQNRVAVFRPFQIPLGVPTLPPLRSDLDLDELQKRRNAVDGQYNSMVQFLSRWLGRDFNRVNLLKIAESLAKSKGIVIDRIAKRGKEGTIVWLCEHARELFPVPSIPQKVAEPERPIAKDIAVTEPQNEPSVPDLLSSLFDAELRREEELLLFYGS